MGTRVLGSNSTPRRWRRIAGFALVVMALAVFASPVALGQDGGESVATRLRYQDPDSGQRVPAVGVSVTVLDAEGKLVDSGPTDDNGEYTTPVDGPGTYMVSIDPGSLPEGVSLRDPEVTSVTIDVRRADIGRAIFPLVSGEAEEVSGGITLRAVAQLTTEGLKLGLFLGMAAIGLSLIFGTTGLVNFSHGEMIGWGMLIAYFFNFYGFSGVLGFMADWPAPFGDGVNLILASLFAIAAGGLLGYAFDRFIFGPLRERGVSLISAMVVTIGLSIFVRYVFLFAFRGNQRFFRDYTAQSGIQLGIIDITPKDLVTGALSIIVLVGVGLFLQRTRMGKAMRAVSDNRDLAESSGIDVQRVIRFVWVSGGALAALGGVFIGLAEQVSWNIGFRILLLIFASVVLGGLGTAYGALVGALVVGVGVQVSTLFIPPELKNVGALIVLILVLVIRPQGILGKAERIG